MNSWNQTQANYFWLILNNPHPKRSHQETIPETSECNLERKALKLRQFNELTPEFDNNAWNCGNSLKASKTKGQSLLPWPVSHKTHLTRVKPPLHKKNLKGNSIWEAFHICYCWEPPLTLQTNDKIKSKHTKFFERKKLVCHHYQYMHI